MAPCQTRVQGLPLSELSSVCPILSLPPSPARESPRRSACLCGPSPDSGEKAAAGSLCAMRRVRRTGGGVTPTGSSDGIAGSLDAEFWRVSVGQTRSAPHTPLTSASLRSSWPARSANWACRPPHSSSGRARSRRPPRTAISPPSLRRSAGEWGAEEHRAARQRSAAPRAPRMLRLCAAACGGGRSQGVPSPQSPRVGPLLSDASPGASRSLSSSSSVC